MKHPLGQQDGQHFSGKYRFDHPTKQCIYLDIAFIAVKLQNRDTIYKINKKMRSFRKISSNEKLKIFIIIHLVFIVAICDSLFGNARDITKELRKFYDQASESKETLYVRRLEKIKDVLPKHGIVGFFTNKNYSASDYHKFFFLTQYSLSPLLITRGTKPKIIIADVNDSFNIIGFRNEYNCRLLKNSEDGILVFQKNAK